MWAFGIVQSTQVERGRSRFNDRDQLTKNQLHSHEWSLNENEKSFALVLYNLWQKQISPHFFLSLFSLT